LLGQTVTVSGKIGRDLVVGGSDFNLASDASVKRDLLFGAQTAQINGSIDGNIKGGATDATMAGKVGGDVNVAVDRLTLASTAVVQGKVNYTSNNQVTLQSGAQVRGTTTRLPPPAKKGSDIPGKIFGFFMITATGIIVLLLLGSARMTKLADTIRTKTWSTLGWGALFLVAVPIAVIIVTVTVVGLPLGLMTLALYLAALYLSQIPVALFIGRLIMRGDSATEHKSRTVLVLVIGLAVLLVLGLIPVIDVIVGLGTVLFGLGSLLAWFKSGKPVAPVPSPVVPAG
jgi:cytoskeletal protein CcmA (bactofilin family)